MKTNLKRKEVITWHPLAHAVVKKLWKKPEMAMFTAENVDTKSTTVKPKKSACHGRFFRAGITATITNKY